MDVDGPMFGPDTTVDFGSQLKTMVTNGVQSIRAAFSWAAAQPYKTDADVPADRTSQFTDVGGVPTSFQVTDMIVGDAARERLTVLPTVLYAPDWDSVDNPNGVDTPRRYGPYAAYLTALIGRYGPHGSFWRANPGIPKMPIRSWQVWNEPNLSYYWKQPFASTYVSFLRTAHAAIKKADPGAQVVLGALTNTAWKSLGQIYRIKGARSLFDVVAVNGFTKIPAHVMLFMLFVRHAMARFGDNAKPLLGDGDQLAVGQGPHPRPVRLHHHAGRPGPEHRHAAAAHRAAAPRAAPDRLLLVHVDGGGVREQHRLQLLRAARVQRQQGDRQARPGGVPGRRPGARGLQAQGPAGHQLHQVGHGAGAGPDSGWVAPRRPAANAAVSGVPALGSVGLAIPNQSCGSAGLRSGVTQV